jgi:Uncharacterised ArCR, COG2043
MEGSSAHRSKSTNAMTMSNWIALGKELEEILHLRTPPVAITFSEQRPDGVAAFDDPVPAAMPDGRTGRVPAGCVFWVKATQRTFSTVPEDHRNCSVGQLTHGMATLDDVRGNSDVVELLNRPSPAGHGDVDIAAASEPRCLVARRPYTTGSTIDAKRAENPIHWYATSITQT